MCEHAHNQLLFLQFAAVSFLISLVHFIGILFRNAHEPGVLEEVGFVDIHEV